MQIILVENLHCIVQKKWQQQKKHNKITISFPGKTLLKLKKTPPKNQTISILYLL